MEHYLVAVTLPGELEGSLCETQRTLFRQYGCLAPLFPCIPLMCYTSFPTELTRTFRQYPMQFTSAAPAVQEEYLYLRGTLEDPGDLRSHLNTADSLSTPIPLLPGVFIAVMTESAPLPTTFPIHTGALSLSVLTLCYDAEKWYQALQWQILWQRRLPDSHRTG